MRPWVLLLALACGGRGSRRLEGRYDLGDPGAGWVTVQPGGADRAWRNEALAATLYADSSCGERFDDAALPRLHASLTAGVAGAVVREEPRTVDGREALLRIQDGRLDGVDVRVGVLVLKKDACLYDLVYIAPPSSFDKGLPAFEALISAFKTQVSP